MVGPGGKILGGILKDLEAELDNYYGSLNEIRLGVSHEVPQKPTALIYYEQTKELGVPLVEGGLVDQPHIWLQQYAICMQREKLWKMIAEGPRNVQNVSRQTQ